MPVTPIRIVVGGEVVLERDAVTARLSRQRQRSRSPSTGVSGSVLAVKATVERSVSLPIDERAVEQRGLGSEQLEGVAAALRPGCHPAPSTGSAGSATKSIRPPWVEIAIAVETRADDDRVFGNHGAAATPLSAPAGAAASTGGAATVGASGAGARRVGTTEPVRPPPWAASSVPASSEERRHEGDHHDQRDREERSAVVHCELTGQGTGS